MNNRATRSSGSWPVRRIRSFGYALKGLGWLVRFQPNAQIHLVATIVAIGLSFWLKISRGEWCAVLTVIGMVWTAEALNTALEVLADHLAPDEHPLVGRAKDVAAGGVLMASLAAALVGAIVFGGRLLGCCGG